MPLNFALGIATAGRADVLRETLLDVAEQTRRPDRIVICAPDAADMAGAAEVAPDATLLIGSRGLTRQRNDIMDALPEADVILFLDDDFLPHRDFFAVVEEHLMRNPGTVLVTGTVIADGIKGPGFSVAEGRALVATADHAIDESGAAATPVFSGYGCNMAFRMASVRMHALSFDERLPLYGWQEDVDFSRRLSSVGGIVKLRDAKGVHLGVKVGRNSGVRLGYSQVANPLYLAAKQCGYPRLRAWEHIARNIASNLVRAARPEPYIDRRGRLRGNLLAFRDMVSGRMRPENAQAL